MSAWQHNKGLFGNENYVLLGEGFYVSFNPDLSRGLFGAFGSDNGSPETALVVDEQFYILNGDFREDYERLVPQGTQVCLDFFRSKQGEFGSSWTSPSVRSQA